MLKQMPKQEYLAGLQARNRHNRQVVETVFVPLDKAQRSWQPEPGEWSVDQCFQHLIIAFEWLSPHFIPALNKPAFPDSDGIFRHTLLASLTMEKQFDPKTKAKSVKAANPTAVYKATVLTQWLDQQARLAAMIEQAREANLQTMCRIMKWLPVRYNLGDYLRFYVSHDELHIDQARRSLAAYERQAAIEKVTHP